MSGRRVIRVCRLAGLAGGAASVALFGVSGFFDAGLAWRYHGIGIHSGHVCFSRYRMWGEGDQVLPPEPFRVWLERQSPALHWGYRFAHSGNLVVEVWYVPLWFPTLVFAGLAISAGCFVRERAGCCRGCGYDLRGNESGICPECGQPADAAASKRSWTNAVRRLGVRIGCAGCTGCLLLFISGPILGWYIRWPGGGLSGLQGAVLWVSDDNRDSDIWIGRHNVTTAFDLALKPAVRKGPDYLVRIIPLWMPFLAFAALAGAVHFGIPPGPGVRTGKDGLAPTARLD